MPLFTRAYKWVLVNLKLGSNTATDYHPLSLPGWSRNIPSLQKSEKSRADGQLGWYIEFTSHLLHIGVFAWLGYNWDFLPYHPHPVYLHGPSTGESPMSVYKKIISETISNNFGNTNDVMTTRRRFKDCLLKILDYRKKLSQSLLSILWRSQVETKLQHGVISIGPLGNDGTEYNTTKYERNSFLCANFTIWFQRK